MHELQAPAGTEVGTDLCPVGQCGPRRRDAARQRDDRLVPQALEVRRVLGGDLTRRDCEHDVLLAVPGIVGPVRRTREHRRCVADDVLVMHQVRHTGDRLHLHSDRFQTMYERPVDLGWWRHRDGHRVVLVEDEPHGDPSFDRGLEGGEQRVAWRVLEPQVVDRDVQALGRAVEEGGDPLGDHVGGLAAVGQEIEVERTYRASAFGSPVCSRGSSMCTGSGRVAISAASSGSSVSVISFRSSGAMAPAERTCSSSQPSKPFQ